MAIKFKDFKQFARKISYINENRLKTNFVLSKFSAERISLLPVLKNDGKDLVGYISRKKLFLTLIEDCSTPPNEINIKNLVDDKLEILNEESDISDVMDALKKFPAVLIRNKEGVIEWVVSPRVAANALEEYSKAFREIEKIETIVRLAIDELGLDYSYINLNGQTKAEESTQLSFGHYIMIFMKSWDKLGISLDRKYVHDLMDECRIYRNQLVHFKTSLNKDRNKKLTNLFELFYKEFKHLIKEKDMSSSPSLN